MRARWLRDEKGKLLASDGPPPCCTAHYANNAPVPMNLPSGSRKIQPEKQSTRGALGWSGDRFAGQTNRIEQTTSSRRTPERVLRAIWGISRRPLRADCEPLAYRAILLWHAGFPAGQLFDCLRFAAGCATDVRTGDRGRIACAILGGKVMQPDAPIQTPPSGEEFRVWLHRNTPIWRSAAAHRARMYRENQTRIFWQSEGFETREQLRQKCMDSLQGVNPETEVLSASWPSGDGQDT